MEKGRILLVSYAFPPVEGGVSMAAFEMACSLNSLGWRVHVLTKQQESPYDFSLISCCSVTSLPESLARNDQKLQEYLSKFIRDYHPNFIIYHSWSDWSREELIACARQFNIPFILRSHGTATGFLSYFRFRYPPFFGIKKWISSFVKIKRDVRRICNKSSLNRLVVLDSSSTFFKGFDHRCARKLKISNYLCIPNTFPALVQQQPFFRKKYGLLHELIFSCPASACTTKQQLLFIRHVKRTGLRNIIFLFLVPQRNAYAKQMEEEIGDDLRFRILYNLPREEIKAAIIESNVVFLYSCQEQQPLCLLEAMSCGVPWIAPNVGCISLLKGGIVLKRRTVSRLKQALASISNEQVRTQLGKAGYEQWHEHYNPNVVYRQWETLFYSIGSLC